jgi:hypothetical protein
VRWKPKSKQAVGTEDEHEQHQEASLKNTVISVLSVSMQKQIHVMLPSKLVNKLPEHAAIILCVADIPLSLPIALPPGISSSSRALARAIISIEL